MYKKGKILDAAMKLLVEHGLQSAPISAIARQVGTGMGTIYSYFQTREGLINAAFINIRQKQFADLPPYQRDEPIINQVSHFLKITLKYVISHPLHFRYLEQF